MPSWRCGIPIGPATNFIKEIKKLKPSQVHTPKQLKVFKSLEEFFGVPSFEPQEELDPFKCSDIGVHLQMGFKDRTQLIPTIQNVIDRVISCGENARNDLVVVHGVPGVGKTKSFEALLQTDLRSDLFVVGVTFNSSMPIDETERSIAKSLPDYLGTRLLCILSRMIKKPVKKDVVCHAVLRGSLDLDLLDPQLICEKILDVSQKKHLLLLVDEPLLLVPNKPSGVEKQKMVDFFSKICSFQDTICKSGGRIVVVYSGLLRNIFEEAVRAPSNRSLNFIPLHVVREKM